MRRAAGSREYEYQHQFSERAENFDEMSSKDTHEPDDSEQISLDLLNFVIPEIEGSCTSSIMS